MSRNALHVLVMITLLIVLGTTAAFGQVSQALQYQGRLTDAGGNPLTAASANLQFDIYDAATSGNLVFTQSFASQPLSSGQFTVVLSSADYRLTNALAQGKTLWVQTTVNSAVLAPRQQITSVLTAFKAQRADTATYALTGSTVLNGSIGTAQLVAGAVTTPILADGIDGAKLAAGSVNGSKLIDATVPGAKLTGAGSINGSLLTDATVQGTKLVDGSVPGAKLTGAGSISGSLITDGTVPGTKLTGTGSIGGALLTDATVSGAKLAGAGSINGGLLADGTVSGAKLAGAGSISGGLLTDGTVPGAKLTGTGSINGGLLTDATVPGAKLTGAGSINSSLIGGAVANATHAVQADSVANTPGIASATLAAPITLTSPSQMPLSVPITVPGPGWIQVQAAGWVLVTQGTAQCTLSMDAPEDPNAGAGLTNPSRQSVATDLSSTINAVIHPMRVFEVAGAGTRTFYFNIGQNSKQYFSDALKSLVMTACYYPKHY